jgi:hypothetical protein
LQVFELGLLMKYILMFSTIKYCSNINFYVHKHSKYFE